MKRQFQGVPRILRRILDAARTVCNGQLSVRPSVCPVDSSRLLILICRRRQSAAASGQRQCCDPRRIDADLLLKTCC